MTNSGAADEAPDAEPRVGDFWDERLDEWLETIAGSDPPGDVGNGGQDEPSGAIQDWSFPTDALRDEYLTSVGSRSEDSVLRLLRRFLFEDAAFDADFRAFRAILCDGDAAARGTALPNTCAGCASGWERSAGRTPESAGASIFCPSPRRRRST